MTSTFGGKVPSVPGSPPTPARRPRRRARRRRPNLLGPTAVVLIACAAALGVWALTRDASSGADVDRAAAGSQAASPRVNSRPTSAGRIGTLVERRTGTLSAPIQDAGGAPVGRRQVALLGGLTPQDTSTDAILLASAGGARRVGRLPLAVHDTAAVRLGDSLYVFGGGRAGGQTAAIIRVDPKTGAALDVGRLPAPSSDQSAVAIGTTAYVVGGYTGARWLDTIVAWRPGAGPRVIAHLPSPLRYAAVAAAGDAIVIAGGSLSNGSASRAVLAFTPANRRLIRVGTLPAPTTHAAAAAIGQVAYVVGGRGPAVGTPTSRVVAVDVGTRRIRLAGALATPRSDLVAVSLGGRILLAGGRGPSGTVPRLSELVPAARRAAAVATPSARVWSVYAHDRSTDLAPAAQSALPRVYVPNSQSATVDVIDQRTYRIVGHFQVGALPQHVTPAYDLRTLYVTNDLGNSLTAIDPRTGRPGRTIPVDDPYNLYFTPGGRYAIVVAERLQRLDFRDAHSFRLRHSLSVPCVGVDHMDFSADGRYLLASCEFSGQMIKVNVRRERVVGVLNLPDGQAGMPQDVKLSADGRIFYVADQRAGGVWEIDGERMKVVGFIRTGLHAHGLYPSRDGRFLYVTNRGEGSISVISFRTRKVVAKWRIPGGGSPDMGGVSADGRVLWVSGRYNAVVYAISTRTGRLVARIPVGQGPHGLCVWPQPGRYSLGHTGNMR